MDSEYKDKYKSITDEILEKFDILPLGDVKRGSRIEIREEDKILGDAPLHVLAHEARVEKLDEEGGAGVAVPHDRENPCHVLQ